MALIGNPIVVGYNNAGQGQGYGTCSTAAATVAKVVTLANYNLQTGGVVSVKFTYAVPASATLNINSRGAKSIRYRGAALETNVIKAGDIATFMYDGTYYQLISVDRWGYEPNFSGAPTAPTAAVGTNTTQIATTEFVQNQIQNTNAGDVAYDSTATYSNGTVGYALNTINDNFEDLNAGEVAYSSSTTYDSGTVGRQLKTLSDDIDNLGAGDVAYSSSTAYSSNTVGSELSDIKGSLNSLDSDVSALEGSLNVFEKAKSVSSTSDFGRSSFNFSVTAAFSIGNTGVTLPRYCKGSFICSGSNDAVLYGVDLVNGVFYFAARNSGTWAFARTYDESYHPFTVTGTIGNGTMYIDDTRITANTRLLEVEFGTPKNVPYKYSWTTSAGRLTFANVAGTFSETTVTAILGRTN